MLSRIGAQPTEVRRPDQLDSIDALVMPGGESTTISMGIEAYGFEGPLGDFAASGRPVLATCAGLILLDRSHLGLLDVEVERNAYGRQIRSFEASVDVRGLEGGPFEAVFIRAPRIIDRGAGVEMLAEFDGDPVAVRQDNILAVSFHPELTGDPRLHAMFCELAEDRRAAVR